MFCCHDNGPSLRSKTWKIRVIMLVTLLVKFRNKDCRTTELGLLLQVLPVRIVTFVETLGSHLKIRLFFCDQKEIFSESIFLINDIIELHLKKIVGTTLADCAPPMFTPRPRFLVQNDTWLVPTYLLRAPLLSHLTLPIPAREEDDWGQVREWNPVQDNI